MSKGSRILELMRLQIGKNDLMQKRIWRAFANVGESDIKQKAIWNAFKDKKTRKKIEGAKMGLFSLKIALDVRLERENLYIRLKKAIETLEKIAKTTKNEVLRVRAYRALGDLVDKSGRLLRDVEVEELERTIEELKREAEATS